MTISNMTEAEIQAFLRKVDSLYYSAGRQCNYVTLLRKVNQYRKDFGQLPASWCDLHQRPILTIEQVEEECNIIYENP